MSPIIPEIDDSINNGISDIFAFSSNDSGIVLNNDNNSPEVCKPVIPHAGNSAPFQSISIALNTLEEYTLVISPFELVV